LPCRAITGCQDVLRRRTFWQQRGFKTVPGQTLSIDQLSVVTADIETANGIVHVSDSVVMASL
jgi:hypothetical protein